jgi:hypothetical protein
MRFDYYLCITRVDLDLDRLTKSKEQSQDNLTDLTQ